MAKKEKDKKEKPKNVGIKKKSLSWLHIIGVIIGIKVLMFIKKLMIYYRKINLKIFLNLILLEEYQII